MTAFPFLLGDQHWCEFVGDEVTAVETVRQRREKANVQNFVMYSSENVQVGRKIKQSRCQMEGVAPTSIRTW